jgi:hypothetical protein
MSLLAGVMAQPVCVVVAFGISRRARFSTAAQIAYQIAKGDACFSRVAVGTVIIIRPSTGLCGFRAFPIWVDCLIFSLGPFPSAPIGALGVPATSAHVRWIVAGLFVAPGAL